MAQRWWNVGSGRRVCIALVGKTHFFEFSSLLHWLCRTCNIHTWRVTSAEGEHPLLLRRSPPQSCGDLGVFIDVEDFSYYITTFAPHRQPSIWSDLGVGFVNRSSHGLLSHLVVDLHSLAPPCQVHHDTMWTNNTSIYPLGAISHTYSLLFIFTHQTCSKQSIKNSNLWGNSIKDHVLLLGM
jgi:hypothetical protein